MGSKEAMRILGISSPKTLVVYEKKGLPVFRPFSNRKRFKVSDLEKYQNKG